MSENLTQAPVAPQEDAETTAVDEPSDSADPTRPHDEPTQAEQTAASGSVEPAEADRTGQLRRLSVKVDYPNTTVRSRQWVVVPKRGSS